VIALQPDALIFAACGTLIYLWLVVVSAPVVCGLRTTLAAARGDGWGPGLAVAIGLVFSATVIPIAALFLAATFAPALALTVIAGRAAGPGALCGATIFATRATLLGLPRLSPRVELALVSSSVAWSADDQVEDFEQAYREHVLPRARTPEASRRGPATRLRPGPVLQHRHTFTASPDANRR
jgi:hypothetical protein